MLNHSEILNSEGNVNSNQIEEIREKCAEEIKKLEIFYEDILKQRMEEHEKIFEDIDKIILDKETEIEKIKEENKNYKSKLKQIKNSYKDLENENEDHKKRLEELTIELDDISKSKDEFIQFKKSIEKGELIDISKLDENNMKMTNIAKNYKLMSGDETLNFDIISKLFICLEKENENYKLNLSKCEEMKGSDDSENKTLVS